MSPERTRQALYIPRSTWCSLILDVAFDPTQRSTARRPTRQRRYQSRYDSDCVTSLKKPTGVVGVVCTADKHIAEKPRDAIVLRVNDMTLKPLLSLKVTVNGTSTKVDAKSYWCSIITRRGLCLVRLI